MGESTWTGVLKKRGAKTPYKRDLTHQLFRMEDKKFLREHKLGSLSLFTLNKDDVGRFLTLKD